jgi:hypothetical protein
MLGLALAIAAFAGVSASPAVAADPPPDTCPGGKPNNPAGSASVWTEPQCLSSEETDGEVPQVAIADDGSAVAVWGVEDPEAGPPGDKGRYRVQFAYRKPGGNFEVPKLSDPPPNPRRTPSRRPISRAASATPGHTSG